MKIATIPVPNYKFLGIQGGFEFKCESAFFYEFCVTNVKILFDIQ